MARNGAQVHAVLQKVRDKTVPQRMDVDILADTAVPGHQFDGLLDTAAIHHPRTASCCKRAERWLPPGKGQIRMVMRRPVAPQGLEGHQRQGVKRSLRPLPQRTCTRIRWLSASATFR